MTFSIRATIRVLAAPKHRISCSRNLWESIAAELFLRGEGKHEAGAFLLGVERHRRIEITDVIFYDELDPHAYDSGVCILHADAFGALWKICRERRVSVVADAHTHPGLAVQSHSDRTNPMVARSGHVAIILPNFAKSSREPQRIGIYEYRGDHNWTDHSGASGRFFYVGFWS
jgi:hypothetical protein